MGIQINGATDSITAIDGTIDVVSAIGNAGVVTATAFVGNITGNVTGNINHASNLELQVGGVTRANIDSTGKVGINQSSPDYELDVTGRIGFTQQIRGASGSQGTPAYAFDGDHDTGMFRNGVNNLCFGTAGIQRLTIDENGKIGLGVNASNPSYQLQIHESDNTAYAANATVAQLAVGNVNSSSATNAAGIHLFTDGNGRGVVNLSALNNSTNASADFVIQTRHSATLAERLRITSDGQIGIGNIIPDTWSTGHGLTIGTSQATLWGVGDQINLSGNAYFNSGWKAAATKAGASQIQQALGNIDFRVTGSINADAAITWTEAVRITPAGVIGINDTNPGTGKKVKVVVDNNSSYQMAVNLTNNVNADINFYIRTSESLIAPSTNTPLLIGTGGEEKLRIDNNGYVGINDNDSTVGLSINKFGTQPVVNGNTYPYPAGNWSTVWNTTTANNTDYWCGFVGGYNVSGATVNISLSPNTFNFSTQQGIYIAGEATSTSSADFTIGKIIGGSVGGASASAGNQRATKSEFLRITSRGYREIRNYHYGPWAFINNTYKSTITVGDPGDGKHTTIKFILTLEDVGYRQGFWQGEFVIWSSNSNGGPGVSHIYKKIWDNTGSTNWNGGTVVYQMAGGAFQFKASNDNGDAAGNAYIHILDVIGDIDGSTVASISS